MNDSATPNGGTPAATPTTTVPASHRRRRSRVGRLWERVRPHTGRGFLIGFFVLVGFGSLVALGGMKAIAYTETADFCGRCHTMAPELKAFAAGAHKDLTCAECHVEPGAAGWVKAKVAGTKQLVQVLTNSFPTPIEAPDHDELPPTSQTCQQCHAIEHITGPSSPVKVVLRPRFQDDKANTRELVAVVLRPNGLGGGSTGKGVHWHVQETVTFTSSDERDQDITSVQVINDDGTTEDYIAGREVGASSNGQVDLDRLRRSQQVDSMDCITCHNRVGHPVPSAEKAVDEAMAQGEISAALPYVKRDAVAVLNGDYRDVASADRAIDALGARYAINAPKLASDSPGAIARAVATLKTTYRLLATPEMRVQAQTYADNLGHRTAPGCFRCHDGTHYKVVKGKVTKQVIPSTCSTCHTFPQIGAKVTNVLLGAPPADHKDRLYVFGHSKLVSSTDPSGSRCGACHNRTYCENCHNSGAVRVTHDSMLYSHADSVKKSGAAACAYCHQPVYCATCHTDPVLGTPPPGHSDGGGQPGTEPARVVARRFTP